MNEKTNLFLFSKKEVFLLTLFIIALFTASFVFGVKIGKNYTEQLCDITPDDQQTVDLLSEEDELVESLEFETPDEVEKLNQETAVINESFAKLQDEFDKLAAEKDTDKTLASVMTPNANALKAVAPTVDPMQPPPAEEFKDQFSGKYTIQMGSYNSEKDAEKFADTFKIRGYDIIINQVELKDRGIWYRVGLGAFDTIKEAKAYIEKEKALFNNADYMIGKFK